MQRIAINSSLIYQASLPDSIVRIAENQGFNVVFFSKLSDIKFDQIQVVISGRLGDLDDKSFDNLIRIRLDLDFRGTVLVLSFSPRKRIIRQEETGILNTQGCFYLQLPFRVEDFVQEVMRPDNFSDKEMKQVVEKLGIIQVSRLAREIGHNHVNALSLALAHFNKIEKLSYYKSPALKEIIENTQAIHFYLTGKKIENFRKAVVSFIKSLEKWQPDEYEKLSLPLDSHWKTIGEWFDFSESLTFKIEFNLSELFHRAKLTETALRSILTVIQTSKRAP